MIRELFGQQRGLHKSNEFVVYHHLIKQLRMGNLLFFHPPLYCPSIFIFVAKLEDTLIGLSSSFKVAAAILDVRGRHLQTSFVTIRERLYITYY